MNDELQHQTINGNDEYIAALDQVCAAAQRSLVIFENDFDNLGFNSVARYDILHHFLVANPQAKLQILAHSTQYISRYCPRLMLLLRQFGHRMSIYQTPKSLSHLSEPFAVADELAFVRRFHFNDSRGILALNDSSNARLLKSRFEEMWAASHTAVSADSLGI
ncbi:MAG: hypothetical protein RLZZ144_92 [Pseudomonadota bacterium]|jgi:hypothetical protein